MGLSVPVATDHEGDVLAGVDALVRERVTAVAGRRDEWDGRPDPLLGELDLPELLASIVVGGKRVRPRLVHWGHVAAGGEACTVDEVVLAGAALELLHVFGLVHDDIMDDSDLRRGHPSTHVTAAARHRERRGRGDSDHFGRSVAILVGDLAHAQAESLAAGLSPAARQVWTTLVTELVIGQCRDLTGAAMGLTDLTHTVRISMFKTGGYTVERPLELGAVIADGEAPALAALHTYGRHLGIAFGLRDDILGTFGDPLTTGKPNDDDLTAGKPTVLMSLAREHLTAASRRLLDKVGREPLSGAEVATLREAMDECGVRERVETMIAREVDQALGALADPAISEAGVAGLTHVAHELAWRTR